MKFNPDEVLPYWCNRTAYLFRAIFDQRAEALGLRWSEGVILLQLGMGHNTLADLTRNLEHSHPAILRQLDKLEKLKLIERKAHSDDRRIKILELTDAGQKKLGELREMAFGFSNELYERFGRERIEPAIQLMREVTQFYGSEIPQWCPTSQGPNTGKQQVLNA
ncbi:MAG: winged helix-turn-helix transcriptional regulator [bacterium]|nr:winged helix-turn-helix transcriptional regulator [bacterium]